MAPNDDNILIYHHNFFRLPAKNRLPDPSEIRALEFKREFLRFGICSVPATIGIDRTIFDGCGDGDMSEEAARKTVSADGRTPCPSTDTPSEGDQFQRRRRMERARQQGHRHDVVN